MYMFLFLVVALAVVVAAVTLAVVGGGESAPLPEAAPERYDDPLPPDRPVGRAVEALRFPLAVRGYRMADVDDALGRLGAEIAERDSRIADLEAALAGSAGTASPWTSRPMGSSDERRGRPGARRCAALPLGPVHRGLCGLPRRGVGTPGPR
ncbi:DivIVA domain-containing protein [Streptomyces sp. T1317-0309]|nr:DivIVA domain-containing protein [Streptomyces sp. T1317-0309]